MGESLNWENIMTKICGDADATIVYRKNCTHLRIQLSTDNRTHSVVKLLQDMYNTLDSNFTAFVRKTSIPYFSVHIPVENKKDIDKALEIWKYRVDKAQKDFDKAESDRYQEARTKSAKLLQLRNILDSSAFLFRQ